MHQQKITTRQHDHIFGQDKKRDGESRTLIVVVITAGMMVIEVAVGIISGSMALLADGLHMASHASALGINLFAYHYARRHAHDPGFSFGTGKVNSLGGFTGAVLLGVFAAIMAWESLKRFFNPMPINFNQAIYVAILGLIVNGVSVLILNIGHGHHHAHDHHEDHAHHHDHNLRSAYLHVLADALTSVLAIFALLGAKYLDSIWMDPLMGIVGAILVIRWSAGLLRTTSAVLLDKQGPEQLREKIKRSVESDGDSQVTDLHIWAIGPNLYAVIISVVARQRREPDEYKKVILLDSRIAHVTVETCRYG